MRLILVLSILFTGGAFTTVALAAGFPASSFASLPWWPILLVGFPVVSIALIRMSDDP
ncbi:MAG: hypothetical protein AAGH41_05035 [Pseudomonadota bacterium]